MAAPYIPSPTAHLSLVFEQGLVCDLAIGRIPGPGGERGTRPFLDLRS